MERETCERLPGANSSNVDTGGEVMPKGIESLSASGNMPGPFHRIFNEEKHDLRDFVDFSLVIFE